MSFSSDFVIDKIFYDKNCTTPWLLTREPLKFNQTCSDVNTLQCTNNTLNAFYAQSCLTSNQSKEIPFDYVKVTTNSYPSNEFVYLADGVCRRFSTLMGDNGYGINASCINGQSMIQTCDVACRNCIDTPMADTYTSNSCQIYPKSSHSTSLGPLYLLILILVNIF